MVENESYEDEDRMEFEEKSSSIGTMITIFSFVLILPLALLVVAKYTGKFDLFANSKETTNFVFR